jgi:galactokinase
MTASECVERLLDHGLADVDRAALHDVSRRVLEALPPGGSVLDVWWTPGRLEVFGTHTDYAGGRSLVCAVPRGMLLAARRRIDGRVVVTDAASGESVAIEPGCDPSTFSAWRRYVAVVVDRLSRNFPGAVRGCEIAFESTLARASGMSSSSALVIALASALVSLNDLAQQDAWTANIRSPIDAAGYYACIENGRTFGGLAGTSGVGTHGGSEDHAAILTGRRGIVTAFRFAPMTRLQDVAVPADWRFVIATSNVRAEKTGPAQASYNRLADEVQVLLDWWIACETPASSLADALRTDAAAADRLREIVKVSGLPRTAIESLTRRLDHFVGEDAIVGRAPAAFADGDRTLIGELSAASQAIAESLLRNQVAETVELARNARRLGAFAARSFGAGFGGSVWALLDDGRRAAERFAAAWHPEAFIMQPGPPHTAL